MAACRKTFVNDMRIEPGSAPKLDDRDPGFRPNGMEKKDGLAQLEELTARLDAPRPALPQKGRGRYCSCSRAWTRRARTARSARAHRGQPAGVPVVVVQGADRDRARPGLPLAHPRATARRAGDRDLQPLALRGRGRRPRAQARARGRCGEPLQPHPRVRAAARPTRAPSSRSASTSRKEEQRERLQERLDDPEKRWKFRLGDLDDRERWDDYRAAYEDAITETSTDWAPWYVVPADHKWVRNLAIAEILVDTLERLDPKRRPRAPARGHEGRLGGAIQPDRAPTGRAEPRNAARGAPLSGHAARAALPADPLRHPRGGRGGLPARGRRARRAAAVSEPRRPARAAAGRARGDDGVRRKRARPPPRSPARLTSRGSPRRSARPPGRARRSRRCSPRPGRATAQSRSSSPGSTAASRAARSRTTPAASHSRRRRATTSSSPTG